MPTNGNGHRPEAAPPETPKRRGGKAKLIAIPILLFVLAVGGYFGYQYLLDQEFYVSTDNAQIAGSLIQVGAVNAGRVDAIQVDIGDTFGVLSNLNHWIALAVERGQFERALRL